MRFTHVGNKCLHSVFPNQCSDTYFRIVSFICFLFITCTRNKTFSEEIERSRDIPLTQALPSFTPSCLGLELFTLNCAKKDRGSCTEQTGDRL